MGYMTLQGGSGPWQNFAVTLRPPVPFFLTLPGDRGLVLSAATPSAVPQKWPSSPSFSQQCLERSRTCGSAQWGADHGHVAGAPFASFTANVASAGKEGSSTSSWLVCAGDPALGPGEPAHFRAALKEAEPRGMTHQPRRTQREDSKTPGPRPPRGLQMPHWRWCHQPHLLMVTPDTHVFLELVSKV